MLVNPTKSQTYSVDLPTDKLHEFDPSSVQQILAGAHRERVRPPPEAILRRRLGQQLPDEGPRQERRLPARMVPDEQGQRIEGV